MSATAARGAATVYLSQHNAKKTLETGVTTVRNLNATDYEDIAIRDMINAGLMVGPRMYVSGYGLHISRGGRGGPSAADGVAEVMKVVRAQIAVGAGVVTDRPVRGRTLPDSKPSPMKN